MAALSVKGKIRSGTMFLFLLLVLTGGAGVFFTADLKSKARDIIRANYESVVYGRAMQLQLDSLSANYKEATSRFDQSLTLQEHNITEVGEAEATQALRGDFERVKAGDTSRQIIQKARNDIQQILLLNLNAIGKKNELANTTAERAMTIIIMLVVLVFLVGFSFAVNFPAVLTRPMSALFGAIAEISNKNYAHRIHIDNTDEFGALAHAINAMAERLQYFENSSVNKLLFEKARAEAVINSLKDASIGIDKNDVILFANVQAQQLLGLRSGDVVGKTVAEVSRVNDLFRFLVANESQAPFKIVVDNRENYFVKEIMEVAQQEGSSRVLVLRNITSFKEQDAAKTNFIATISHELKTPLAASDFSLKLLEDERIGTLSAEQRELIQNLKQDNYRVRKILGELLNLSQVEAGRMELNMQQVNPYLVAEQAIETVAVSAREKRIDIRKLMDEDLPLMRADAEKTTWVLNNFLTNAIKNSPEGSTITLRVKKTSDSVQYSVADQGPGIAPEYLPRIFERYFKVPGSGSKGTGIGLAISKEFVDAQQGRIWAESEVGRGSVFSFSLSAFHV